MDQQPSAKSLRRQARKADANARMKENNSLAPALKMFNDGLTSGPIRKKVSKLSQSNKLIINATETNKKKH